MSDHEAWLRSVIEDFEPRLLRYAARLLADPEAARDVVQDTFVRLCREEPGRIDNRVGAWLYTVCRNRAMDVRKKESRMNPLSDVQAEACTSREANQAEALEQRETAGRARSLLNQLPENQREVVRLKVEHGLSYREIADVTGLSVSNVGFLIHKGIKTIRERFVLSEPTA